MRLLYTKIRKKQQKKASKYVKKQPHSLFLICRIPEPYLFDLSHNKICFTRQNSASTWRPRNSGSFVHLSSKSIKTPYFTNPCKNCSIQSSYGRTFSRFFKEEVRPCPIAKKGPSSALNDENRRHSTGSDCYRGCGLFLQPLFKRRNNSKRSRRIFLILFISKPCWL